MTYPTHPPSLYDTIIDGRTYDTIKGTTVPVRPSVIDKVAAHAGETELQLERPDGSTHTLTSETPIPPREELVEALTAAQRAFDELPVSTLTNLLDGRLGPLHYMDATAHFTVGESIFEARPQHGTGPVPRQFRSLGVKAAHLCEGFELARDLPYHWVDDVGWSITRPEQVRAAEDDDAIPEDRAPPIEECFVINVPITFPAQSFGQATGAPAEIVNRAIAQTEQTMAQTLLTKRMAQLDAIEQYYSTLETEIDRELIEETELDDLDTVITETFGISKSGLDSLRSQVKERRRAAFQTARQLAASDDFNYVMGEFAETIDELGQLAMLGTKYREEILDEPPGFY